MMNVLRAIRRRLRGPQVGPIPVAARHAEYSVIMSADDEVAQPSDYLIDLVLRSAQRARTVSMAAVVEQMKNPPFYPAVWPGEHYKLLAGVVAELKPTTIVEIGTSTGLSALAMMRSMSADAGLTTFDIVPWDQFADTNLKASDFAGGRLVQVIGDVGDPGVLRLHLDLFQAADLVFVDGPKDGVFEQRLIEHLSGVALPKQPVLIFDDIRVWNMLAIWRGLPKPKLDATSFGHWSGTGFVHWT